MIYIFFSERLLIYFSLVNIELQPVLGSSSKKKKELTLYKIIPLYLLTTNSHMFTSH